MCTNEMKKYFKCERKLKKEYGLWSKIDKFIEPNKQEK